jgi:hypothetical protein
VDHGTTPSSEEVGPEVIFSGVFAIVVGVGMIGQWTLSLVSGQVPELRSEPIRIRFHLAAEFATALALLVSGIGLLAAGAWARDAYILAAGMLLYTIIVSPGYFAQQGKWLMPALFAAILVLVVVTLVLVL